MNKDELYRDGWDTARLGHAKLPRHEFVCHGWDDEDEAYAYYTMGYEDYEGEVSEGVNVWARPVDDEYYINNLPPRGYEWTGEKKTPEPGEYYLTKNGNAKLAEKVRGNAQKRHILRPI